MCAGISLVPHWRALVGVMQIEPDGIRYVRESDKTAVLRCSLAR